MSSGYKNYSSSRPEAKASNLEHCQHLAASAAAPYRMPGALLWQCFTPDALQCGCLRWGGPACSSVGGFLLARMIFWDTGPFLREVEVGVRISCMI